MDIPWNGHAKRRKNYELIGRSSNDGRVVTKKTIYATSRKVIGSRFVASMMAKPGYSHPRSAARHEDIFDLITSKLAGGSDYA